MKESPSRSSIFGRGRQPILTFSMLASLFARLTPLAPRSGRTAGFPRPWPKAAAASSRPGSLRSRRVRAQFSSTLLERPVRPDHRPPHVGRRRVVPAEAFRRLLEMAPDDVDERVDGNDGVAVERVEVVHRHQTRMLLPLVVPPPFIRAREVRLQIG